MKFSPLQMGILLSAYTGSPQFDWFSQNTEVFVYQKGELFREGMIDGDEQGKVSYKITEKGRFWIEYVLNLPFPVQEWRMPNEHD